MGKKNTSFYDQISANMAKGDRAGPEPSDEQSGSPSPPSSSTPPPEFFGVRPVLVTISAIVSAIGGLLLIFLGIGALIVAPLAGTPEFPTLPSVYEFIGSGFTILGALALVSSYGIIKRLSWAWRLGVIVGAIQILQIAFISDLYNVLIGVAVIYLYTRRPVRQWVAGVKTTVNESRKKSEEGNPSFGDNTTKQPE